MLNLNSLSLKGKSLNLLEQTMRFLLKLHSFLFEDSSKLPDFLKSDWDLQHNFIQKINQLLNQQEGKVPFSILKTTLCLEIEEMVSNARRDVSRKRAHLFFRLYSSLLTLCSRLLIRESHYKHFLKRFTLDKALRASLDDFLLMLTEIVMRCDSVVLSFQAAQVIRDFCHFKTFKRNNMIQKCNQIWKLKTYCLHHINIIFKYNWTKETLSYYLFWNNLVSIEVWIPIQIY